MRIEYDRRKKCNDDNGVVRATPEELYALYVAAPELLRLLGLITAEFKSDPASVQCFDLQAIVYPAIALVAKLESRPVKGDV